MVGGVKALCTAEKLHHHVVTHHNEQIQSALMTRSDLIDALASRFPHLVTKDAEVSVKLLLGAISQALANGGRAEIRGFGSFGVTYRPSRTGRNPKSGEKVDVPAKSVPYFKAGKELRIRVETTSVTGK